MSSKVKRLGFKTMAAYISGFIVSEFVCAIETAIKEDT